jgi:hypothetical protein
MIAQLKAALTVTVRAAPSCSGGTAQISARPVARRHSPAAHGVCEGICHPLPMVGSNHTARTHPRCSIARVSRRATRALGRSTQARQRPCPAALMITTSSRPTAYLARLRLNGQRARCACGYVGPRELRRQRRTSRFSLVGALDEDEGSAFAIDASDVVAVRDGAAALPARREAHGGVAGQGRCVVGADARIHVPQPGGLRRCQGRGTEDSTQSAPCAPRPMRGSGRGCWGCGSRGS